ncbi:MAG: DUF3885 domain-containing protein [Bacteroidia bacterium]|nr:DUF3885 domain-containing protein [Bacteroidia bacterium]MBP7260956.1 DUF3885 domain-containing protein [Bacteroidia bacterium]MBP9180435.1 DUF3885 domain-containing protein [Bacteroidia bacterium]MBP9723582.1 DUF3885 domain-containing protein [Bacteroidia bacterium]
MTTKQEYRQFLNDNFKGLRLRKPLFYSWDFGLRFDLQTGETSNSSRQILDGEGNVIPHVGDTDTDEYFQEVTKRASTIFKTAFDNSDKVFLVFMDYKYKRRKIKFSSFTFKQVDNLKKFEISFSKEKQLYEPGDKFDIRNVAIIKLTADRINYKNILTAIGHSDFPPRQPRLDNNGFLTSKEIYFINIDKKLIFHMYDDRGLDLISTDKETLRPIYKKHNDWILDYDRKQIDKQFE